MRGRGFESPILRRSMQHVTGLGRGFPRLRARAQTTVPQAADPDAPRSPWTRWQSATDGWNGLSSIPVGSLGCRNGRPRDGSATVHGAAGASLSGWTLRRDRVPEGRGVSVGDLTAAAALRLRAREYDVVIRPRRSLVRSTALSIVFSAVPLAVALVWMSLPLRLWALVVTVVLLTAVVVGVTFVRLGTAFIGIDAQDITIHGVVTANRRIPRDRVHRLVVVTTYGSSVERTTRGIAAFDADGEHLFRLRADVWDDADIERVVDALGVQVTEEPRPMPAREFAKRYPSSRAWYEQRGAHIAIGALATVAAAGLVAVETTGLLGP